MTDIEKNIEIINKLAKPEIDWNEATLVEINKCLFYLKSVINKYGSEQLKSALEALEKLKKHELKIEEKNVKYIREAESKFEEIDFNALDKKRLQKLFPKMTDNVYQKYNNSIWYDEIQRPMYKKVLKRETLWAEIFPNSLEIGVLINLSLRINSLISDLTLYINHPNTLDTEPLKKNIVTLNNQDAIKRLDTLKKINLSFPIEYQPIFNKTLLEIHEKIDESKYNSDQLKKIMESLEILKQKGLDVALPFFQDYNFMNVEDIEEINDEYNDLVNFPDILWKDDVLQEKIKELILILPNRLNINLYNALIIGMRTNEILVILPGLINLKKKQEAKLAEQPSASKEGPSETVAASREFTPPEEEINLPQEALDPYFEVEPEEREEKPPSVEDIPPNVPKRKWVRLKENKENGKDLPGWYYKNRENQWVRDRTGSMFDVNDNDNYIEKKGGKRKTRRKLKRKTKRNKQNKRKTIKNRRRKTLRKRK